MLYLRFCLVHEIQSVIVEEAKDGVSFSFAVVCSQFQLRFVVGYECILKIIFMFAYRGSWVYIRLGLYPVGHFFGKFYIRNRILNENSKEICIRLYPVFENLENFADFMGIYPRI